VLQRTLSAALTPLLAAAAFPTVALADGAASLILHTAKLQPWTVWKFGDASTGKIKIFDTCPQYQDGKVSTNPVAVLKDAKDSFEFDIRKRNYWFVVYPNSTNVSLKLHFIQPQLIEDDSEATLIVDGTKIKIFKDTWIGDPALTFKTNDPKDASWDKARFEKAGTSLDPKATAAEKPFIVLD
jgi:hypothetical protein